MTTKSNLPKLTKALVRSELSRRLYYDQDWVSNGHFLARRPVFGNSVLLDSPAEVVKGALGTEPRPVNGFLGSDVKMDFERAIPRGDGWAECVDSRLAVTRDGKVKADIWRPSVSVEGENPWITGVSLAYGALLRAVRESAYSLKARCYLWPSGALSVGINGTPGEKDCTLLVVMPLRVGEHALLRHAREVAYERDKGEFVEWAKKTRSIA